MSNIVVIKTSLRVGSNSNYLADSFICGAKAKGHTVSEINLKNLHVHFCEGCLACQKTGKCVLQDDVASILETISNADILCFATPIYYYGISGQMKTFLDRLNPLYGKGNRFKDFYLIATCADEDPKCIDRAIDALNGFIECFEGTTFKDSIRGAGLDKANDAKKHEEYVKAAYDLGYSI